MISFRTCCSTSRTLLVRTKFSINFIYNSDLDSLSYYIEVLQDFHRRDNMNKRLQYFEEKLFYIEELLDSFTYQQAKYFNQIMLSFFDTEDQVYL